MNDQLIISRLHQLPEELKVEVLHYIEFLSSRYDDAQRTKTHKRTFGSAEGKYRIAPDFNAPLGDFKDYM